jgi:hypothetical protein
MTAHICWFGYRPRRTLVWGNLPRRQHRREKLETDDGLVLATFVGMARTRPEVSLSKCARQSGLADIVDSRLEKATAIEIIWFIHGLDLSRQVAGKTLQIYTLNLYFL